MKFLLAFLVLCGVVAGAAPAPNGKLLYTANCAACHGLRGEGGTGGLSPNMLATQKASFAAFRAATLQGVGFKGKKLQPVMPLFGHTGFSPAYGKPMSGKMPSDAELKAMLSHIKTLKGK